MCAARWHAGRRLLVGLTLGPHFQTFAAAGKAIRAELAKMTGRSSVPNIWIAGESVGGCNDGPGVVTLQARGGAGRGGDAVHKGRGSGTAALCWGWRLLRRLRLGDQAGAM